MKKVLVVPSIREEYFNKFIESWSELGDWDEVILIEDSPTRTFDLSNLYAGISHYSWNEIEENRTGDAWIFSRRDSAIRCYGFYIAYHSGADYILTLDDDCYPHNTEQPIFQSHIDVINSYEKWTTSCGDMRTRGLPYKNKGKLESVVANMGLWSGIPDLDAISTLHNLDLDYFDEFRPPEYGNKLIPRGQYFPLCGMNFCFKREVAPLAYFPLMGEGQPYSRFDDIWFGIIFKKIIDHLGLSVSVGEPFVEHRRASNVFTNLRKEAPGIEFNERFWIYIDEINLSCVDPKNCMKQIGCNLENNLSPIANLSDSEREYMTTIGRAMQIWANLF